jgi:hypothetical protein
VTNVPRASDRPTHGRIRRCLTVSVAVALCVGAIVGTASAWHRTLTGSIDPSGSARVHIGFKRIDHARFRVYRWSFDRVPLRCGGRRATARDSVDGSEAIRNSAPGRDEFGYGVADGGPGKPSYAARVRGRLVRRDKARGILRVHGTAVPLKGGGQDRCDSGRLHWIVRG